MFKINNPLFGVIVYTFLAWIAFTVVERLIWFTQELFNSYYIGYDFREISQKSCQDPAFARALPTVCTLSTQKTNVPYFLQAFNDGVLSRTYSCIDYPCSEILFNITNSVPGMIIAIIIAIITLSRIMKIIEDSVMGRTDYSNRKSNSVQYVALPMPTYEETLNNNLTRRNQVSIEQLDN
jgi:hypothetical protein